uniref:potassium transporter TrkG n=1 Tax=Candidatus Scatousia sp. TaxID=3085663 RepID=UPI0040260E1C
YSIFEGVTHALYQVISIMTSTGSASVDFEQWDFTAKVLLFGCMFLGACASSAGGGIKMTRWLLLVKTLKAELTRILHPNAIINIKLDNVTIAPEVIRQTVVFIMYYFIIFAIGALVIGILEQNAIIGLSGSITAVGNIGPGFGQIVGPMGGFSSLHAVSKSIMIASMLIGRLEIVPFLVMLQPDFWNFKDK